jgi:hypothetical protein
MKRKNGARSPPTTRNIPELGISESIPLTEYYTNLPSTLNCLMQSKQNIDVLIIGVGAAGLIAWRDFIPWVFMWLSWKLAIELVDES